MGLPVKTGNIVGDPETLHCHPASVSLAGWVGYGDEVRLTLLGRWAAFLCALYRGALGGNRNVVSLGSY